MCSLYWDTSLRILPLTKEYVDKHKKDIIKNKENKENNTILERKGKYWDLFHDENPEKYSCHQDFFIPPIHPDKYKLPCCFLEKGHVIKMI